MYLNLSKIICNSGNKNLETITSMYYIKNRTFTEFKKWLFSYDILADYRIP